MDEQKKRMTAKRKLEVYLETRQKDANVEEILRRIETLVERAALDVLKGRPRGEQAEDAERQPLHRVAVFHGQDPSRLS